jgi:hypothetical protein
LCFPHRGPVLSRGDAASHFPHLELRASVATMLSLASP